VAATTTTGQGPFSLGAAPWQLSLGVDRKAPVTYELPVAGGSDRVFLLADPVATTLAIPANGKLYLEIENGGVSQVDVALTSGGAVALAALITDIDAALTGAGLGACQELGTTRQILILGAPGVTRIDVRLPAGSFAGPNYVPPDPDASLLLGFAALQKSPALGSLSVDHLKRFLSAVVPGVSLQIDNERLSISSASTAPESHLTFGGGLRPVFGLPSVASAEPNYLALRDAAGTPLPAAPLGVLPGGRLVATETGLDGRSVNALIDRIDGEKLYFSTALPRGLGLAVKIVAPLPDRVPGYLSRIGAYRDGFVQEADKLRYAVSPLLAEPSRAQIADAKSIFDAIRVRLTALKAEAGSLEIREDQKGFARETGLLLSALDDRGLDLAADLLRQGRFGLFFAITREAASSGGRLLKAVEEVGRKDLAPRDREDQDLRRHRGTGENSLQDLAPRP